MTQVRTNSYSTIATEIDSKEKLMSSPDNIQRSLAKQMPEKLHELQRLWLIEAVRNNVLPLQMTGSRNWLPVTGI
jgi:hypothetical protein